MQTIITSRQGQERYNAIIEDCVLQIKEYATNPIFSLALFDIEKAKLKDEAANEIFAINDEYIYTDGGKEFYEIEELSLFDALTILAHFEKK